MCSLKPCKFMIAFYDKSVIIYYTVYCFQTNDELSKERRMICLYNDLGINV